MVKNDLEKEISILRFFILFFLGVAIIGNFVIATTRQPLSANIFEVSYGMGEKAKAFVKNHSLKACLSCVEKNSWPASRRPLIPMCLATISFFTNRAVVAVIVRLLVSLFFIFVITKSFLSQLRITEQVVFLFILLLSIINPSVLGSLTIDGAEESYGFPLLLVACLIVFKESFSISKLEFVILSFALTGLIFTKSSYIGVAFAVVIAFVLIHKQKKRTFFLIGVVSIALLSIAVLNKVSSGSFTIRTSLDWFNVYKGNNPLTLDYIKNQDLDSLHFDFKTPNYEWQAEELFKNKAFEFVTHNPRLALKLFWIKIDSMWFRSNFKSYSFNHVFSKNSWLLGYYYGSQVIFRLLLWLSFFISMVTLFRNRFFWFGPIFAARAISFLLITLAYSCPYLIGFGYQRHAVLLYCPMMVYLATAGRSLLAFGGKNRTSAQ